jgi:hypothetical protein
MPPQRRITLTASRKTVASKEVSIRRRLVKSAAKSPSSVLSGLGEPGGIDPRSVAKLFCVIMGKCVLGPRSLPAAVWPYLALLAGVACSDTVEVAAGELAVAGSSAEVSEEDPEPDDGAGGAGSGGEAGAPSEEDDADAEPAPSDAIGVTDGDFQAGDAPAPTGAEALPAIARVTAASAVTNGGTAVLLVELTAPVEAPRFVVQRPGDSGFHTVVGVPGVLVNTYEISIQIAAEASDETIAVRVALTDAAGNVGAYSDVELQLVQSGTGDVKITLSYDRVHDLDLHVFEPNGEELSYQNSASSTDGVLDLDSGANCMPGGTNSENVFWPSGNAPSGEYRITVHNYEHCTPGEIHFTVRVAYEAVVNTFSGTFADGTAGQVVEVARFSR